MNSTYKVCLKKPDGRDLVLYSRTPIKEGMRAPSPRENDKEQPERANPHLRWHALRGEWVAYASHRQNRTFLPPKEYNPLLPMKPGAFPTELPEGNYDVAVFENLFPSLILSADSAPNELGVKTEPGVGRCEVVVFTQDSETSLGKLSLPHLELLIEVWADRYQELGAREEIKYVLCFENRGVEVGVTLHHPHGQIYSYPFIPPIASRELEMSKEYFKKNGGRGLLEDLVAEELRVGTRVLYEGSHIAAFVPAAARYPYEVWIAPKKRLPSLASLGKPEREDLARALKTVILKYDGLWQRPFPYLMALHQAPTDGEAHPESHFHFEFSPPYRTKDRLKYLAGTELAAGMFANDSIPEEKARELQNVKVSLDV